MTLLSACVFLIQSSNQNCKKKFWSAKLIKNIDVIDTNTLLAYIFKHVIIYNLFIKSLSWDVLNSDWNELLDGKYNVRDQTSDSNRKK